MPIQPINVLQDVVKLEELCEEVAKLQKTVRYLLGGHLDTENIFEVAGWQVTPTELVSKDGDVGMSTDDTGPDPVRFFAGPDGSLWYFYVTKSGSLVAQKATIKGHIDAESGTIGGWTIEGNTLTSNPTNYPRIVFDPTNNEVAYYGSATEYLKINFTTGIPRLIFSDQLANTAIFRMASGNLIFESSLNIHLNPQAGFGGDVLINGVGILNALNGKADKFTGITGALNLSDQGGNPVTLIFNNGVLVNFF